MPKQIFKINDWSGGMNNRRDPRDLSENEYSYIRNMSIDAIGKIKSAGGLYDHKEGADGTTDLSEYIVECTNGVTSTTGGYNLFYFESDHSKDPEQSIIYTRTTTALQIGNSVGNIKFTNVETNPDLSGVTIAPELVGN